MHEHTHLTRSNGIVRFCEGGEGRQGCLACPNGMIDFNKPGKWDTRDLRSAREFFSAELESSGQGGAARESPQPPLDENEPICFTNSDLETTPSRDGEDHACGSDVGAYSSDEEAIKYMGDIDVPSSAPRSPPLSPKNVARERRLLAASMVHRCVDAWSRAQWLSAAGQWQERADRFGERIERSVYERQLLADRFGERIEAQRMRQNRFTGQHSYEWLAELGATLPISLWLSSTERTVILPLDNRAHGAYIEEAPPPPAAHATADTSKSNMTHEEYIEFMQCIENHNGINPKTGILVEVPYGFRAHLNCSSSGEEEDSDAQPEQEAAARPWRIDAQFDKTAPSSPPSSPPCSPIASPTPSPPYSPPMSRPVSPPPPDTPSTWPRCRFGDTGRHNIVGDHCPCGTGISWWCTLGCGHTFKDHFCDAPQHKSASELSAAFVTSWIRRLVSPRLIHSYADL